MKRMLALILPLCLLLSGCTSWMDGYYYDVTPYLPQGEGDPQQSISVSSYSELCQALTDMVEDGRQAGTLTIESLQPSFAATNMDSAIRFVLESNPIGTYAVESITYELGTTGGKEAVALTVVYNHNLSEIPRIRRYAKMEDALQAITDALDSFSDSIVLRTESYAQLDLPQLLQSYADTNPQLVMEMPQITVNTYPEQGADRVVEVLFTYQSTRDALRSMKEYVAPVFSAAAMYVRGDTEPAVKYAQLYTFLMERNPCTVQTSITPSYSLLRYGVGDSKAFAQVFAAMCRNAGLECLVISGTFQGEPRHWNMIQINGEYFHVDLLACSSRGSYATMSDEKMTDYVWDYSAYPPKTGAE